MIWKDRWAGATVVVMASGPSLTMQDVELVRKWWEQDEMHKAIVTNTTFKAAPWADVLAFHDFKWWKVFREEVREGFAGEKVTIADINAEGVQVIKSLSVPGNSGAMGLALATYAGAAKVILLGADCKHTNGRKHWHGDHPKPLGNAASVKKFLAHYARIPRFNAEVVNATRDTDLKCFERVQLEEVLT